VVVPLTEIVDEPDGMAALGAVDLGVFEWVVVTSANAARRLVDVHGAAPADGRPRLAAVGTQTAAVLAGCDLVPTEQHAEGLLADLPAPATADAALLVVQAVEAAPTLVAGLVERGWRVTAITPYRSVPSRPRPGDQLAALAADVVLFASGSAARAWVAVFGTSTPPVVVAIGPQTAAAATAAGLTVTVVATEHSVPGLVAAAERALAGGQ
jgi:uroporphyrinogen-III synthase